MNPRHPFARFSAGSKATLQTIPAEEGIDVASELIHFFRDHYIASKATLVVIGRDDLSALDRWISPFSNAMSQKGSGKSFYPPFPDPSGPPTLWALRVNAVTPRSLYDSGTFLKL